MARKALCTRLPWQQERFKKFTGRTKLQAMQKKGNRKAGYEPANKKRYVANDLAGVPMIFKLFLMQKLVAPIRLQAYLVNGIIKLILSINKQNQIFCLLEYVPHYQ